MSQDDHAARESSSDAEALGEDDVAPANEPVPSRPEQAPPSSSEPQLATHRRAKLVLADSVPPPPNDEAPAVDLKVEIGTDGPVDIHEEEPAASDVYLDKVIADRYEVLAYLGRGSMGTVYSCRHRVLGKHFAVKIIRQDLARDVEAVSRFVTEAKAASAIGSKHIVEVLDYGELPDGAAYIVMEQLEGETLYRLLAETPRPPIRRVLDIAIQVADALGAAHAAGVVHRDLKPDNVFLVRGPTDFVKILDFGIAKVLRSGSKLTQAGSVMGTPAYMSPEQCMGTPTDARTDIYALGIILYEMAAGEVPFDAENPVAVLSMQVSEDPPELSERLPADTPLPAGYQAVVEKCLAKDPDDRFQSMEEVKAALEKIAAGGVPVVALPASDEDDEEDEQPPAPTSRRRKAPAASSVPPDFSGGSRKWWVGGAALLLVGLGGAVLALRGGDPKPIVASASAAPVAPPPPTQVETAEPEPQGPSKEVHLILFPLDAHAYDGKTDLGMMPITIKLEPGEVKHITVARRGYVPRRLIIDGSKSRLVVGLVVEGASKVPLGQAEKAADEAAAKAAGPAPEAPEPPAAAAPPAAASAEPPPKPAPAASN